jgi:hypothetical protein
MKYKINPSKKLCDAPLKFCEFKGLFARLDRHPAMPALVNDSDAASPLVWAAMPV